MTTERSALRLVQSLRDDTHTAVFAHRLLSWLTADGRPRPPEFSDSRARALLRGAAGLDDPTLHNFQRLVADPPAARVALYDLLDSSGLADNTEVTTLALQVRSSRFSGPEVTEVTTTNLQSPASNLQPPIAWPALAVAAYAWKNGYPLHQFDPAASPSPDSPAGQVLQRAAHFLRRQTQRTATERDKLARQLSRPPGDAPNLDELRPMETPIAPLPPVFRPPIPVRYPEVARETMHIAPDTLPADPPPVTRGEPLVITPEDLPPTPAGPPPIQRGEPLVITPSPPHPSTPAPLPSPLPASGVILPTSGRRTGGKARPGLGVAVRQAIRPEPTTTTKLRIKAQQYPDGPGYYGLQVRVSAARNRVSLAGVTDQNGQFLCELPVQLAGGLTYDVDLTWPRDEGGETERKSITLNADRTEFVLPFYRKLKP